jgi:glycosyltransferase involved in cell wall biosynthesis
MNPQDRKIPICFLTNAYPDPSSPNPMYGQFIRELVKHLIRHDVTISVVTPRLFQHSKAHEFRRWERVYRFWFWSGNRLLIEYGRIPVLRLLTYIISGVVTALRILQRDSCRLIHAHWGLPAGFMAVVVGRVLKKPVILTVHGSDARLAFEKRGLFRWLFGWTVRRADVVTTVSQNIAERVSALGIHRERIQVFPMGVSEDFFSPLPGKRAGSKHPGKTVVVSNRHLLPLYNVDCLIRAIPCVVPRCDQVLFLVAGEGDRRPVLESMARQMDLLAWVRFLGSIPHEQMPALLKSSHIYVSTSLSDGTSVSLLEAMACGLFPVVTDIPANREWIEDGKNGFLVPTNDELALAERLTMGIEDEGLRQNAREMNIKRVREKASWERISQKVMAVYEGLGV